MGRGKNNKTTQKTTSDPWAPIQPYLKGAFADAQNVYQGGAPGYFPGQTVADMSGYSQQAYANMANRAMNGNPLMGQAGGEVGKILGGGYLDPNNNPGFQGALSAALRPVTDAYRDVVMPGIDSNFSSAGRYGSGLQGEAYRDANSDLARGLGDISSNMVSQNYGMERGNMMSALNMAPGFAADDWKNISMLGLAGQGLEGYDQSLIDAEKARYDYNANKDMSWLGNYIGLLGGAPPPSSTSTVKTPAPNPFMSALGLGLQGASMLGGIPSFGGGSSPYNPMMVGSFY